MPPDPVSSVDPAGWTKLFDPALRLRKGDVLGARAACGGFCGGVAE